MSTSAPEIAARLQTVRERIARAALAAGRRPEAVTLLAVSKTFDASAVWAAVAAGQHDFGENYAQEGAAKVIALAERLAAAPLNPAVALRWHFIGPVQSNKTRLIAGHFDRVSSLDSLRIAERLAAQRPPDRGPLEVLLQVNISGEASKSGVAPAAVVGLAAAVLGLPGLRLRGLMAIPEPQSDPARRGAPFAAMRELFDAAAATLPPAARRGFDTLSIGMSDDLEAAIAAGATEVRVGSAIFGPRVRPAVAPT